MSALIPVEIGIYARQSMCLTLWVRALLEERAERSYGRNRAGLYRRRGESGRVGARHCARPWRRRLRLVSDCSGEVQMKTARQLLEAKGHEVWSIGPKESVSAAIELMAEKGIGALLVMEGANTVGVISERDCLRKVFLKKARSAAETEVREIMTKRVIYAPPDHSVEECMALMTDKRIRHLPVLENGKLVGVISIGDLVKAIIDEQQFIIDQLVHYITG